MPFANPAPLLRAAVAACGLVLAPTLLGGCTVITLAGAAVGVAASGVGLAVDATVGTVKAVGSAVLPGSDEKK